MARSGGSESDEQVLAGGGIRALAESGRRKKSGHRGVSETEPAAMCGLEKAGHDDPFVSISPGIHAELTLQAVAMRDLGP